LNFELTILGSNSAIPAHDRHQSSQLLNIHNHYFLIDCGEGTQMQLNKFKIKIQKINHIFISHLHGDHYLGLIGLISTMHLQGREKDLFVYGPPGLNEIITLQLKYSQTILNYKIHFKEFKPGKSQIIFENDTLWVETLPLKHRVACCGFIFKEKTGPKRINKQKLNDHFSLQDLVDLKNGKDILDKEGNILYKNQDYTLPPKKTRAFAYCSDTIYDEEIIEKVKDVDVLYHEATFLNDKKEVAKETMHTTAKQAADIAKKAEVNLLIIGHYSIRYKDLSPLLEEAKAVFPNVRLAIEGETIKVDYVSPF
jgi:ribonuclease Z